MLAYDELKGSEGRQVWYRPPRYDARRLFPGRLPRVCLQSRSYMLHNISLGGVAAVSKENAEPVPDVGAVVPLQIQQGNKRAMLGWLAISGLLAAGFVGLEIHEFIDMIAQGAGPGRSAFLSSFFALVGTHGLHVTFGLIWIVTMIVQVGRTGLTSANIRRLTCLSMFWHFLDVIWIGVFTFVYLMGVLP